MPYNGRVFAKVACRYFQFSTNIHSHFCKYLVSGSGFSAFRSPKLKDKEMIKLEYFNGTEWINTGTWANEWMAWASLGGDDYNYRTVDENGNILTDKSVSQPDR